MEEFLESILEELPLTVNIFLSIIFSYWVFRDAKKHKYANSCATIWGIATFFVWFFFLPLWILLRPRISFKASKRKTNTSGDTAARVCALGFLSLVIFLSAICAGIGAYIYWHFDFLQPSHV